jgi:hypothetical protein
VGKGSSVGKVNDLRGFVWGISGHAAVESLGKAHGEPRSLTGARFEQDYPDSQFDLNRKNRMVVWMNSEERPSS